MTIEELDRANAIVEKRAQCQKALDYQTQGSYHAYSLHEGVELNPLPEEVCGAIRDVIQKFVEIYDKELAEL